MKIHWFWMLRSFSLVSCPADGGPWMQMLIGQRTVSVPCGSSRAHMVYRDQQSSIGWCHQTIRLQICSNYQLRLSDYFLNTEGCPPLCLHNPMQPSQSNEEACVPVAPILIKVPGSSWGSFATTTIYIRLFSPIRYLALWARTRWRYIYWNKPLHI